MCMSPLQHSLSLLSIRQTLETFWCYNGYFSWVSCDTTDNCRGYQQASFSTMRVKGSVNYVSSKNQSHFLC